MRALLLAVVLSSLPAAAKERWSVKMADSLEAGGKKLSLNGMGQRMKFIVRVYVAGLYLEHPQKDAAKILAADEARAVQMKLLLKLDKKTVADAIVAAFRRNSQAQLPALKDRLDKLEASFRDVAEGDQLTFTYLPGKGTQVKGPGTDLTVPGKDFADALFAVWLGGDPVDAGLKRGMLGEE